MMIQETRDALAEALRHPRYEVIPLDGAEEEIVEHVPGDVAVAVTASPVKGIEATLGFTERLAREGVRVVPHLSARLIADEGHLREILHRMHDLGVRDVFVVAGDPDVPLGDFQGALEVVTAMGRIGHGMEEVGITGYPESHPNIDDDVTIQAMWDKRRFATYIVSNICFDAKVIDDWVRRVRRRGVGLPIYVGMPGAVSRAKLVRISANIGLGESARFLRKHHNRLLRMFLPGGYSPDRLIKGLIPSLADPENKVRGLHVYTFNEVEKTEAWRQETLERIGVGLG